MNMLRKTTWLVTGRILGDGLAFVFYIALARTFGEANIGDYAFAFSLAALFGLGVEFGLKSLLTREAARNRACVRDYVVTVAVTQIAIAIVLALMLHILTAIAGYSSQVYALIVLAFASVALRGIAASFVAYLEAIEAMDKSALLDVAGKVTTAGFGLSLIYGGASLPVVVTGHVLGSFIFLVAALSWVRRHFGPPVIRADARLARRTLRAALPFALGAALYELFARVDIIMLHHLVGATEAGQYAVAVRLVMAPHALAYLIGVAMYPTLSRSANDEPEARDALFLGTLKWLAICGMAIAVLMFSIGRAPGRHRR